MYKICSLHQTHQDANPQDSRSPFIFLAISLLISKRCIDIHPFFAGVTADIGAGWTWDFWQQHDVVLTQGGTQKNVIAETGWPSGGGTDCGEAATCTNGSVAGIDEMNTFMGDFICQSLTNGTNFFW